MNDEFKRFYSSLYTSEVIFDPSKLELFFQSLNPTQVVALLMEQLEKPMSKEEIRLLVITSLIVSFSGVLC